MQGNFTEKAREAITKAQQYAVHLGHNYVGTEHILLGLAGVKDRRSRLKALRKKPL